MNPWKTDDKTIEKNTLDHAYVLSIHIRPAVNIAVNKIDI